LPIKDYLPNSATTLIFFSKTSTLANGKYLRIVLDPEVKPNLSLYDLAEEK
jgi:hypothetical protein